MKSLAQADWRDMINVTASNSSIHVYDDQHPNGYTIDTNITIEPDLAGTTGGNIGVGISNHPNGWGGNATLQPLQQPGLSYPQITEADVKRILEKHLKEYIKGKKKNKKTSDDLIILMKEYKFPKKMIQIVIEAMGKDWPVEKKAKPREEDLIHG